MPNNDLSIKELSKFLTEIYGTPNNRLYSSYDLLYYNQKFLFRFLRSSASEAKNNFLISYSWFTAFINRFEIDLSHELIKRFPYKCPKCLDLPCTCGQKKISSDNSKSGRPPSRKPQSVREWQKLLNQIYPKKQPTKEDMLEASDDVLHWVRKYVMERKNLFFKNLLVASADFLSLYLRMANKLEIDLGNEIKVFFKKGCFVCHQSPCICNFND